MDDHTDRLARLPNWPGLAVAHAGEHFHLYRNGQRIDMATIDEGVELYRQLRAYLEAMHHPVVKIPPSMN